MFGEDVNEGPEDGDQKGYIRNATAYLKRTQPVKAFVADVAHDLLDGLGINGIDNKIEDIRFGSNTTKDKLELAYKVFDAVLAISTLPEGGKGKAGASLEVVAPSESAGRGAANSKVSSAINRGKAAHKDFSAKAEGKGWSANVRMIDPKTGKTVIADAVTPSGRPLELKPNTPSGKAKGARQIQQYERATGKKGRVVYYDPKK